MSTIKQISDFKSLKQLGELSPAELKAYTVESAKFVKEFNEAFPDGKPVKVNIDRIILGDRVNFVVAKHPDLSSTSFSFSWEIADIFAANVGAGTADGLNLLIRQTLEPLQLSMTVRAVGIGDEYKTKDGTKTYKAAAAVKVEGTREEVMLSKDAKEVISDISRVALTNIIMGGASRRGAAASKAVIRPEVVEEEADV